MTPLFRIRIDGLQDATARIRERLLSLTVTDEAGRQSDTVEIVLDDREPGIKLPRHGAEVTVSLGYEGRRETVTGSYTVDETELAGPGRTLVVRAKGADMRATLKVQKTRSWTDVALEDLVARIAAEHGLEPRVSDILGAWVIPHLDQTEESDLHLLTRLARDYDAVAKPAGGYLLFVAQGEAASATGKPMPAIDVRPEDTSSWRVTLADRKAYRSVRAHWHDAATGERRTETAGSGDPARTLRRAYASGTEATAAARAKLAELTRGTGRLSVALSPGNPVAAAEAELRPRRFRAGVDGSWTASRVTHKLAGGGYSTRVEATFATP